MEPWFTSFRTTLAYFDQFSHPLTATELWNFLWQPPQAVAWNEYLSILDRAVKARKIATSNGFYFLPDREAVVESRQRAQVLVERKLTIARKAAPILSTVPGVEAIFVCNTVAAGWPSSKSDIDVLVVTRPGRLWLTRLLFTFATMLLTKRRHDHQIADHLCLSFYVTRDHVNVANVRGPSPDIYFMYWLQQLFFLAGDPAVVTELANANTWVKEYLPNSVVPQFQYPQIKTGYWVNTIKTIGEKLFGDWLERVARNFQKKRIAAKPHAPAPAVVISDCMLKFHEHDKREEYQRIWREKIIQLNSGL